MHNPFPQLRRIWAAGSASPPCTLSDTYRGQYTGGNGTKIRCCTISSSDTVAAYQVGAGFDMAINSRYSLDLGYRYFITERAKLDSDFSTTSELRFESHNATVGFKMKF